MSPHPKDVSRNDHILPTTTTLETVLFASCSSRRHPSQVCGFTNDSQQYLFLMAALLTQSCAKLVHPFTKISACWSMHCLFDKRHCSEFSFLQIHPLSMFLARGNGSCSGIRACYSFCPHPLKSIHNLRYS